MSLTSQLADENSAVSVFLQEHCNMAAISQMTGAINSFFAGIPAQGISSTDKMLSGSAFGYLFRWHIGWLDVSKSLAWNGAKHLYHEKAPELVERMINTGNANADLRPGFCVALALFEQIFRNKEPHPLLEALLDGKPSLTDGTQSDVLDCIQDMHVLRTWISATWRSSDLVGAWYEHPTFAGSEWVGGADANAIIGDMLIEVRTSFKREPFTSKDVLQQLLYALLDYDDQYKLTRIAFYSSRHARKVIVPLRALISDVADTRKSLRACLESQPRRKKKSSGRTGRASELLSASVFLQGDGALDTIDDTEGFW